MRKKFARAVQFLAIPTDNSELLKEQCAALSRTIPLMYFIVVLNAWVLSVNFFDKAPVFLSLYMSLALSAASLYRLVLWWRKRHVELSTEQAIRELRRTTKVAAALGAAFSLWGFALFPYGDVFDKTHVVFFLMISMLSVMLCLTHHRTAVLTIAFVTGVPMTIFFVSTGVPALIGMVINAMLVALGAAIIILIQNRDFARMVDARSEARRRELEQVRLLHMIDDMPVAVMTVEPETLKINYVNETSRQLIRNIEHLLPLKADDLLGTSIDVFHKDPRHQRRILADPKNLPHNARIKLGPEVLDLKVSAVHDDDGRYLGPMLTWALVTKEVEAENRIRQLAHYDILTGLPNRITFQEEVEKAVATAGNRVGLLYIDLDGFKLVNDTRGHHVGDILLGQVASRLRTTCSGPAMTIGRLGGDEFAVMIPHNDEAEALALAERVIEVLGAPYDLDYDRSIQIGASIGIALAPEHGDKADLLLARADIALYAAKAEGKGQAHVFSQDMECRIHERVRLEDKLRDTLKTREGLFVFYQPIVDVETGQVTAREALVRWHHPQRGWISPAEFVPVAEQSGLIDQLGRFVMETACAEAAGWEDGARVAVNVSASQLGKGTLPAVVLSALANSGLAPSRLEVEVTETALLGGETDAIGDLRRLRDMGVRVALDDFGTGYSSLAHLRVFPFDKIKIDGSFVKDALERPDCAAVVNAIADLGKRLGVTTVAEGVETQAHLDCVRAEGCREVQGYFYSRPMPSERDAAAVERLVQARRETNAA